MKVLPSMPGVEQAKQQQKLLGKQSCVMVLGQLLAGVQPRTGARGAGERGGQWLHMGASVVWCLGLVPWDSEGHSRAEAHQLSLEKVTNSSCQRAG